MSARPILGSLLFFAAAPGTVVGLVPWALTSWSAGPPFLALVPERLAGGALLALGLGVLAHSFARFALEGRGTPAPVAPTESLVVSGLYRHVRNPMYAGVLAAILGQALLFGSRVLLGYAGWVALAFHAFVVLYEEPTLRRRYGAAYVAYQANVRRWWPRVSPWRGREEAHSSS